MSSSHSASDLASLDPPVRSSEASAKVRHGSSTTPSPESEAITQAVHASRNGNSSLLPTLEKLPARSESLLQSFNGKTSSEDCDGSNANTPRLPFAKHSSSDLDSMPAEDRAALSPVEESSPDRASFPADFRRLNVISSSFRTATFNLDSGDPDNMSDAERPVERGLMKGHQTITSSSPSVDAGSPPSCNPSPLRSQHIRTNSNGQTSILDECRDSHVVRPPGLKTVRSEPSQRGGEETFPANRNRSSSRSSQSRVEKRIEATLAEAEPATNARSRKSSHMLGLFKENVPQEGRKNSQNTKPPPAMLRDADPRQDSNTIGKLSDNWYGGEDVMIEEEEETSHAQPSNTRWRTDNQQQVDSPMVQSGRSTRESSEEEAAIEDLHRVKEEKEASLQDVIRRASNHEDTTSKKKLPTRLLEEIRQHHNLATPFHDKFRTTQSRPFSRQISLSERQASKQSQRLETRDESKSSISSQHSVIKVHEADEDESDKEQISSALYYPHQAPSPDALKDVDINEARKEKESEQGPVPRLPEAALDPKEKAEAASDVIDINLQSRNRSRHLQGDLQQARSSSGELDYSKLLEGSSSASESETESAGFSSQTDDAELTPRASPTSKAFPLQARSRKVRPAVPLGAVELKPYNHQVGGHTTVFRFSKRAVCKQLTSRENRFYELVEKYHPELLKFLPRSVYSLHPLCFKAMLLAFCCLHSHYSQLT